MRAVVLVGGFGTRLRPLTEDIPKPLLPVGQRPIIEHVVRSLAAGGVTEVVLALGFRPGRLLGRLPGRHLRRRPAALRRRARAARHGWGDRLRRPGGRHRRHVLRRQRGRAHRPRRARLVALHREQGAQATIHLTPVEDPSSFGVVAPTRRAGCCASWRSRRASAAPSHMINAGTYVFEPSMIDRVPVGARKVSSSGSCSRPSPPRAGCSPCARTTTGSTPAAPSYYRQANLDAVSGLRRTVRSRRGATGAQVDGDGRRLSVLGAGVDVAAGADVRASVLLSGPGWARGAVVVDSVLGPGCRGRCGRGARRRRARARRASSRRVSTARQRPPAAIPA